LLEIYPIFYSNFNYEEKNLIENNIYHEENSIDQINFNLNMNGRNMFLYIRPEIFYKLIKLILILNLEKHSTKINKIKNKGYRSVQR
jgi:hypothetical protein